MIAIFILYSYWNINICYF